MNISDFSVKQPVATIMLFLALGIIGAFSASKISVDMYPEVEPPVVSIITLWPGASASDVETEVTEKIENFVNSVNNLDTLTSKSIDNISAVSCKFNWGTNLDVASSDIRDAIEIASKDLPDDAEKPIPFKFSSAMAPIMFVSITAEKNWTRLFHYADKVIGDELKRVPGVGAIMINGGLRRRINVYFDRDKIEAFNLSLARVNAVLAAENNNIPAGSIKTGSMDYFVRIPARYKSIKEIQDTVIGGSHGRAIYLKDVATVEDDFEPLTKNAWGNGKKAVVLVIQKQSGKNTVEVAQRIKKKFEKIKEGLPEDFEITISTDSSENVLSSLANLKTTLFWGIVLIILVSIFFLRQIRTVFIVALIIPASLIIAFILIYSFGYTLNLVTLMSIAIASGMVVDNGIVVLENIMRNIESGSTKLKSAVIGAKEVGLAITASTMTTVVIFVPLMFLSGIAGVVFKPMGFVMVVTLLASLLVALMLTPMLASKLIKVESGKIKKGGGLSGNLYAFSENMFRGVENWYKRLLEWAINHRKTVIILSLAFFISGIVMIPSLSTSFFPESDSGDVTVKFRLPEGTKVDVTNLMIEKLLKKIDTVMKPEEIRSSFAYDGEDKEGFGIALGFDQGPNIGIIGYKLVDRDKRERSVQEIGEALRKAVNVIPGLDNIEISVQNVTEKALSGGAKPISVEIQGSYIEQNLKVAREVKQTMEGIPGLVEVQISQKDKRPELWIEVDRKKASSLGLNSAMVGIAMRNYLYGVEATGYRDAGKSYEIVTRFKEEEKNNIDNIKNIPIFTPDGRMIRLSSIAKIVRGYGPTETERKNRQNIVIVEAALYNTSLGNAKNELNKHLPDVNIPFGVTINFGGDIEEQAEAFTDLTTLLIIGILLVYMLMASLFGNLRDPFIIMFSVPFAFTGVFYAFYFTGTTLGIMSFMGIIMLMGIVVNNAIVLLDYTKLLQKRGFRLFDAVTQAGRDRLRPVLMTTFTTFFSMLPMAISSSVGAEIWNPIGITMLGGLSVSTLVTLVLVPCLYYMFENRKELKYKKA
ncbi:MAG: efflux RND transporter permease subunit [Desulfobacterales bacterium]|jgi:hydrophobe/amphiphile efflux-1 (HAE1) family protein|nr:efflux RND transporter permease subunit [Desulfobacteraceae bacterium]MBT7086676.1 efflux RND transporter permease subunit [Desulfobacterales bacterium]